MILKLLNAIFIMSYEVLDSYGLAVLLLSLIVNILLIPLFLIAERWQRQERLIKHKMHKKIREINSVFKGQERFMMLKTLYRQNGYHPLFVLRNSLSLLIQIPFFLAAYQVLSQYDALSGATFFVFNDLARPDGLLILGQFKVNVMPFVMPFVMTAFNLAAVYIYSKTFSKIDKIQLYVIAGFFFILLYSSPVGLVLYWTTSNVFSFLRVLVKKIHKRIA